MLRDQVSVVAQPIAGALDLYDDRLVQEAVAQRGGDDRVAEDLSRFCGATGRGQDQNG